MKKAVPLIVLGIIIILMPLSSFAQTEYESSSNIQLLYGDGFEPPGQEMWTLTPNYSGSYGLFEHGGFIDVYYVTNTDDITAHLEWYPRVSITGHDYAGPLSEILLGGGLNADFAEGTNSWAWLAGPTWKFSIPGFDSFTLETYYYKQADNAGNDFEGTYHITPSWDIRALVSEQLLIRLTGVVDFIGDRGPGEHQVLAQPQFLLDIGNFWDTPDHVYAGTEWRYWHNKGGVEGVTESVFQLELRVEV